MPIQSRTLFLSVPPLLVIETAAYSIYGRGAVTADFLASILWLICIALPFILYNFIHRQILPVGDITADIGRVSIPMLIPPILGVFGVESIVFLGMTHTCASISFLIMYYILRRNIRTSAAIIFTLAAVIAWSGCLSIIGEMRNNAATLETTSPKPISDILKESEFNLSKGTYNRENNSFRSNPEIWTIHGELRELKKTDRSFTVLKWLLADELQSYINKETSVAGYYARHKELDAYRGTDPWAKKWDALNVKVSIKIEEIAYKLAHGKYEIRVRGKQTVIPQKDSKINGARNMDCSYTITICRTGEYSKKWTVYHVRNNKKN